MFAEPALVWHAVKVAALLHTNAHGAVVAYSQFEFAPVSLHAESTILTTSTAGVVAAQ